jgi:hypothetical protein
MAHQHELDRDCLFKKMRSKSTDNKVPYLCRTLLLTRGTRPTRKICLPFLHAYGGGELPRTAAP